MSRAPHDLDVPDLSGQLAVVTGGSDGMGVPLAARLAAAGAEVLLPVRSEAKGRVALAAIRERAPRAVVSLRALDLASLASVARLAATLREEGRPVHLLVGNAGVMTPPGRQQTQDGFELQVGTNHLGHAALVLGLLPLLRAGQARVVAQVSIACRKGDLDADLVGEGAYDGMRAYRQSKLAQGLFGLELDRRSAAGGWGITSNLSHPGVAPTNLLAARPEVGRVSDTREIRVIRALSRLGLAGTVESAPLAAVLAATSPGAGGRFFGPGRLGGLGGPPAERELWAPLRRAEDAAQVWDRTVELLGADLAPAHREP